MAGVSSTRLSSRFAAALPARAARIDPVDAAAAVLITLSVLWRASITRRGFLTYDDFPIIAQADEFGLRVGHLFGLYNNHFMPAGRLITYVIERLTGYEYWPYATLMLLGQAAVSVAFYRLLRFLLPAGWALLVPLCLFLFNPMTLEISAWWAVGVNMLPLQFAMIIAVGAQVRYLRSGERRHLATLALAVAAALLFFEKAVFIAPLVFLVTLCLYAPGGPVRAVLVTVRRWWPAWAMLTGISVFFLAAYLAMSTGSSLRPTNAAEVGTFLRQFFGESLTPGLLGGPWTWLHAGDGTPVAAPTRTAQWISWALVAALVAVTIRFRRWVAVRAWILLALFSALAAGLIAATRLGSTMGGVAGLVPRYLGDVLLVAALCVGVAVCGLRRLDEPGEPAAATPPPLVRSGFRPLPAALTAGAVLLVASSVYSGVDFGTDWQAKVGRDYLRTAQADLADAEPGTVFMDRPVPEDVLSPLSHPWNMQSRFFGPLKDGPVFVTAASKLSMFDEAGHIRPAWVNGVTARPGPLQSCGYRVTGGRPTTIPLTAGVADYWQVVRIAYLSDRDASATIRVGKHVPVQFDVHRGLHAMFLLMQAEGDKATLELGDPAAELCTNEIQIGTLVPQPAG
ncbi:hypothetical protein DMB66_26870 [Actinoplanes sp. ATCC 53533]|uniref:hypothetical protein n=1 Tax=Actinoplanes sp. ATCC 53533 TaxID=1288362 RepID=UPI000F785FA0|nr:hypothetical protein [Actinoplanes sp. ATCC 53533]RSM59858.1 hypothetical protein DMB66_26870 [Actinoplanes sp. ATCC 53533]